MSLIQGGEGSERPHSIKRQRKLENTTAKFRVDGAECADTVYAHGEDAAAGELRADHPAGGGPAALPARSRAAGLRVAPEARPRRRRLAGPQADLAADLAEDAAQRAHADEVAGAAPPLRYDDPIRHLSLPPAAKSSPKAESEPDKKKDKDEISSDSSSDKHKVSTKSKEADSDSLDSYSDE